jgi:hypothetical protein
LPTTGLVGGCGIGLSLLLDAIAEVSPAPASSHAVIRGDAKHRTRNLEIPGLVLWTIPE